MLQPRVALLSLLLIPMLHGQAAGDALFDQAVRSQRAGKWAEAEHAYRAHLKQFGAKPETLTNLGALLVQQERFAEATGVYRSALKLAPDVVPIRLNLGLAYFKSGQLAPAVEAFSAVLAKQPDHAQARQLRAMSLLELERFEEASRDYAALMPSGDVNVRLGLASAYLRLGRAVEAQGLMAPLFESDSAEVKLLVGQVLIETGQLDEAKKTLQRAAELNPKLPTVHLNLGAAYWRQQDTDSAVREWRKELSAHPETFQANYTLGAALALAPEHAAEAERLLRKAAALKPASAMALYQLARLVWRQSKSAEAISLLQRSVRHDPDYREAHYLLGTILQSLGRKEEAAKEFAAVKRITQDSVRRSRDLFESQR